MYVIPEKKLIYLAQPRTGSKSVRTWLEQNCKVDRVTASPMWPPGWGDHHSIDLPELQKFKERGFKVFCTVRNHWDWMVSIYHWDKSSLGRSHPDLTFQQYVNEWFYGPKHRNLFTVQEDSMVYGSQYGLRVREKYLFWLFPQLSDYVIRFEHQDEALRTILKEPELELPRTHTSDRLPYPVYYDGDLRTKVYTWFKPEIHELGYTFQEGGKSDGKEGEAESDPVVGTAGHDGG